MTEKEKEQEKVQQQEEKTSKEKAPPETSQEASIEYITEEVQPSPAEEEVKPLKSKLKKKEAEIKALKKEKEELMDKYLRSLAEMENLRKRVEREKNEYYQYALSDFLLELLSVLDNFERALGTQDQSNGKSFREGVEMIYRQYFDLLKKKGVSPIEIENKKFDPNVHQALITEESEDIQEPEVVQELQKGYSLHQRLLRPALVKVVIPKKK